jgi:hypothetical protein
VLHLASIGVNALPPPVAGPADRPARGSRPAGRWRSVAVAVAVVLGLCVAAPVGYLVWPIVVGTLHADHGEPSPRAALLRFVFSFEDGPDATGVDRLIVPERRGQLGGQRRDYLKAIAADSKATGWSATFENTAPEPGDRVEIHGDRASVVDHYRARWTPPANQRTTGGAVTWIDGEPHAWRAEARKDRTGWRLWSVTIPPWCGTYSRCGTAPAPAGSPRPSPSPDDPLGAVRSMLPCGPADPLRQYHDCPSASPSPSAS